MANDTDIVGTDIDNGNIDGGNVDRGNVDRGNIDGGDVDRGNVDRGDVACNVSTLTENEIKQLVVEDKWMTSIEKNVKTEMERISQRLTGRIKELAQRYQNPLPQQTQNVQYLENKVMEHLQKMGFICN